MIHTFRYDDIYILVDVESGAVHQLDEPAYAVAKEIEKGATRSEAAEIAKKKYDAANIDEAVQELSELERNREFEAPEVVLGAQMEGMPIKSMCLNVAHDCNLRCKYCFASTGGYGEQRALMSFDTGKAALDFLIGHSGQRHNLEVDFFGGEPLMNFGVVKSLVKYGRELERAHDKKIAFTLTTNCLGIDNEIVGFCNREMQNVVLSLDGRREIHDAMRLTENGKGSFDVALEGAKKLGLSRQQKGLEYYVRGTYTRENLDFANDVLFLNDLGFEQISIEPVVLREADPLSIGIGDLPEVYAEYERLAREYYIRRKGDKWFNFFHFMIDLQDGPCVTKRVKGCGAGCEYVAVTPFGEIYPCHQFVGDEKYRIGSVLTCELDEDARASYRACNVRTKPGCASCWARYYCSGGCLANACSFNGSIFEPYELSCLIERKRLECALGIYVKEHNDREAVAR